MEKWLMTECPACGWTLKTPKGEDDIVRHVRLHAENYHPEMKNASKEDILKMVKKV